MENEKTKQAVPIILLQALSYVVCCVQALHGHVTHSYGAQPWPGEVGCAGPEVTSHKTTQRAEENLEETLTDCS